MVNFAVQQSSQVAIFHSPLETNHIQILSELLV